MVQVRSEYPAAERARWLAELAKALDDAAALMDEIAPYERSRETAELCARIENARLDVQVMRIMRARSARQDLRPEWTKNIPWKLSA